MLTVIVRSENHQHRTYIYISREVFIISREGDTISRKGLVISREGDTISFQPVLSGPPYQRAKAPINMIPWGGGGAQIRPINSYCMPILCVFRATVSTSEGAYKYDSLGGWGGGTVTIHKLILYANLMCCLKYLIPPS